MTILLPPLSAMLLLVSFAPVGLWPVAYFGLVPWAVAAVRGKNRFAVFASGWVGGCLFWAVSLWWLLMPTVLGYVLGTIYLSVYWLLATIALRRLFNKRIPLWLGVPLVWVSLEFLRAHIIPFEWFFLSQSQYERLHLIQVCDLTGQYGLSFFVAMVNGVVADLVISVRSEGFSRGKFFTGRVMTGAAVSLVTAAIIFTYGSWRLGQKTGLPGLVAGMVQEAFPITLSEGQFEPMDFLEAHMKRTMELQGSGCDVVAWPETVIPVGLNREVLDADVSKMEDPEVCSMISCFLNREVHEVSEKSRIWLACLIGPGKAEFYRRIAARHVLANIVTMDIVARVDDDVIRDIAGDIFGDDVCNDAGTEILRAALSLYTSDFSPEAYSKNSLKRAVKLVIGRDGNIGNALAEIGERLREDRRHLNTRKCMASMISVCSRIVGCPILAGGSSIRRNRTPLDITDSWVMSNSIIKFEKNGASSEMYSKIHLVPFSEYVPFKYTWTSLYRFLRRFVPEQMSQLQPGDGVKSFQLAVKEDDFDIITPVCYEGTFSGACRDMVKRAGRRYVLINHSNDGWFVYRGNNGEFRGTTEQYQHLVHYIFRAVELRLPVYRTVNTGISASIDSDGRIVSMLETVKDGKSKRTMIAGALCARLEVDDRVSPYVVLGDVFGISILLVFLTMLLFPVLLQFFKKKK